MFIPMGSFRFHEKLDKELAEDVGSYTVKRWNYRWTKSYGSKLNFQILIR